MRTYLRQDSEAGELRLVMADLWDGQHEFNEYTVVNSDGKPLRGRADMDGTTVHGHAGGWYVRAPSGFGEIPVHTLPGQQSQTIRKPCRRLASKSGRAKCELCQVPS